MRNNGEKHEDEKEVVEKEQGKERLQTNLQTSSHTSRTYITDRQQCHS